MARIVVLTGSNFMDKQFKHGSVIHALGLIIRNSLTLPKFIQGMLPSSGPLRGWAYH
jgi:hypothetical protein